VAAAPAAAAGVCKVGKQLLPHHHLLLLMVVVLAWGVGCIN
jgi:hypothetical protein